MTPKEKAEELVEKFCYYDLSPTHIGKDYALIAVDEILELLPSKSVGLSMKEIARVSLINYWQEVKQEIEKL